MAVEVSELLTTLRLKDESAAGLAKANDQLRQVAAEAAKAEQGVTGLGAGVKTADREFTAAGRSIGAIVRGIDGTATAAAAANRVLAQHADAVAKLRIQHEREGRTATETAEALRRLDLVRDAGLAKARAAGARIEAQFIAQGATTGQATDQLSRFTSVSDQVQRSAESMASRLGVAGSVMSGFGVGGAVAAAALAAIGTGLVAIARAGDETTATLGKLRAATGSLTAARDVYEALYQSSQKTGIAVAESAGTFARFQIAAGEIGATRDQVLKLVDGLQKVAIVSGASGQEGAAAMQQLGQALASGKLNGDELRSLLENMPSLAQQLARELGTNIGQLRKMGEEGQLTADRVFPALLKATDKMAADFDKMPLTMSRSFDILGAAMLNFTAKLDEALGLSNLIARAAKAAADAVNSVRAVVAPTDRETALKGIADAQAAIIQAQSPRPDGRGVAPLSQFGQRRGADAVAEVREPLAQAERDLRRHQQNLAEIDKEGQQERFGHYVAAQQKAADAAKTRAVAEFTEQREKGDKLIKLEKDHLLEMQKIDAVERTGGVSPEHIAAERLRIAREYFEDRKKIEKELAGEEDKDAKKSADGAAKEARARDTVIGKLEAELDAKQRLSGATALGAEAVAAQNVEIEIENKLREAGIPIAGKRTEEEQKYADRIGMTVRALETLKGADKAAADARTEAARESERATREIESQSKRIADDVATSIYEGLVEGRKGQSVLDWFGNLFKRIAIQAASQQIFLPITTAIVGGIPQLFGISGAGGTAGGGGFSLSSLGQLTGLSDLLPAGGISSWMASANSSLFGTAGVEAIIPGGFSSAPTSGLLASGGSLSLGSLASGAGLGFGLGQFANSMLGGNQQNGMIGGGLGSAAGIAAALAFSAIPGIGFLAPFIGGALGGIGGGLIGPGKSVKSYGFRLQSEGYVPAGSRLPGDTNNYSSPYFVDVAGEAGGDGYWIQEPGTLPSSEMPTTAETQNAMAAALKPISREYYNAEGQQYFEAADRLVSGVNAFLKENNLQVGGVSIIGRNKDGPDGGGDAGTLSEAFTRLRFGSADNEVLNKYLTGKVYDDPAKLQAAVEGFKAAEKTLADLGKDAVPAFTQQMDALKAQFDVAAKQVKEYGLSESALTVARDKAIAALQAERAETVRQTTTDLALRRMVAGGGGLDSDLAQQAEAATREMKQFKAQVTQLGLDAAASAALITDLETTQAQERLGIIRRYGEQAADALRQAGGNIRGYLDSIAAGTAAGASPTDRLAAAQSAFDRDRILAIGGDKDALGRITGSADALLSAGRDVYASSGGFQSIKAGVVSGLSSLPVVQSYDAMQAASLTAIQTALESGTLNTSTVILPGGNIVQLAGGITLAGVESRLGLLIEQNQLAAAARAAQHATLINSEGALYALGLIGNATNDNLASFNTNTTASLAASNTIAASNANAMVATMNAGNNYFAELVRLMAAVQRELELARAQADDNAQRQMQVDHDGFADVTGAIATMTRPLQRAVGQQ